MCACCAGDRRRACRVYFLRCSVNGRFLNGCPCIIVLFWKNEGLEIVKMLNKRTNVRVRAVPILRR